MADAVRRGTAAAAAAWQTARADKSRPPTAEALEKGQQRQRQLNLIYGEGCGTCTGNVLGRAIGGINAQDGSRIRCPLLDPAPEYKDGKEVLTAADLMLAQGCQMPTMYSQVYRYERTVEQGDVDGARPIFSVLDTTPDVTPVPAASNQPAPAAADTAAPSVSDLMNSITPPPSEDDVADEEDDPPAPATGATALGVSAPPDPVQVSTPAVPAAPAAPAGEGN